MFTLKKAALLGVAGLAAFSISCSDTDGDEAGGTFTPAFSVGKDSDGDVVLGGTVIASEGNTVTAISAKADGKSGVTLTPAPTLGATVDLEGTLVRNICSATGATTEKSFKIEVTVKFADGGDLVGSGNVTVNCAGATTEDKNLIVKSITLSDAGESYADLDASPVTTYKQAGIASIKDKIDVVAYNSQVGASGEENMVYSPMELDIFYSSDYSEYYGSNVVFYELPAEAVSLINGATKLSQISDFVGNLPDFVGASEEITEIPVTTNTGFLVYTSERDYVAVIITAKGTKSVTLGTTKFPE